MRHKHGKKYSVCMLTQHSKAVTTGKLLPVSVHDSMKQRETITKELAHMKSKGIPF